MVSCQAQKALRALFNNRATSDLILDLDGGRQQFFVHHDVIAAESDLVQQYLADDDSETRDDPGARPVIHLKLPKISSPMKHPDDPPMTPDAYFELYLKYVYGIETPDIDYPVRACCISEIADYMLSRTVKDQCDDVLGEVTVSHAQDRWHLLFFFARRLGLAKTQQKTLQDVLAQFGLDNVLASLQSVDVKRFKELILEIPCDPIQQFHALIRYTAKLEASADLGASQIVLYDESMVTCLHDVYKEISTRWRTRAVLLEVQRLTDRIAIDEWAGKGAAKASCCLHRILAQTICNLLRDGVQIQ